jgi:hypothetical protein
MPVRDPTGPAGSAQPEKGTLMNPTAIRRSRIALSAAVLLLAAVTAGAATTIPTANDPTCATSADNLERRVAADATLPACVIQEQEQEQEQEHQRARVQVEQQCAVTPDAAERRAARHPGNVCQV